MASWSSRYVYTEDNVNRCVLDRGGVYTLICQQGEEHVVFYVGQAANLRLRLRQHLSASEPNACIKSHLNTYACFFRFLVVESPRERDRVNREQIEEYEPSCND